MRIVLATALAVHAVAHLPGFLAAWQIAELDELPYRTTVFGGWLHVGHAGTRLLGLLWLGVAVGLAVAAIGLMLHSAWTSRLIAGLLATSVALCLAGWPEARIGLAANIGLALIGLYVLGGR